MTEAKKMPAVHMDEHIPSDADFSIYLDDMTKRVVIYLCQEPWVIGAHEYKELGVSVWLERVEGDGWLANMAVSTHEYAYHHYLPEAFFFKTVDPLVRPCKSIHDVIDAMKTEKWANLMHDPELHDWLVKNVATKF